MASELSKYCIVLLTDEYNTSKIDSKRKKKKVEHSEIKIMKKQQEVYRKSHKLCYCKHKIDSSSDITDQMNLHKVWWNRDYNASRNILYVMKCKLMGKKLGKFNKNKLNEESISCSLEISLGQPDAEKERQKKK